MKILKTPLQRFDNLPGYSFQANYCDVGPILVHDQNEQAHHFNTLNMHYVDYGDKHAPVVLMLHGEPSWSYLYREMINDAEAAGFRVIAPDLIGFGKSDKFNQQSAYTYANHLLWLTEFIKRLGLCNIHLICQDWGGLLGLRVLAAQPEWFASLIVSNTMLPTGERSPSKAFIDWQEYSQQSSSFDIGNILQGATCKDLIDEVIAAYNAPFPDETYKAGARKFPLLVPTSTSDPESTNNKNAWATLSKLSLPVLTLFSDCDPITKGGDKIFQKLMPGCKGQAHTTLKNGGHFLQEDCAHNFMRHALKFIKGLSNG
ncbi:MAG: haloalkane dehalogenase [Glaciecola sp.]